MARHETISAWFWITNSWLSTGGLLFFLRKPMAFSACVVPAGGEKGCRRVSESVLELQAASPAAARLYRRCWRRWGPTRPAGVREHTEPLAAPAFKNSHEEESHKPKQCRTTPTFFLQPCLVKSDDPPSHFRSPFMNRPT